MSKNNYEMVDMLLRMMSSEENVLQNIEAEGQQELIRSTKFPKDMHPEKSVWEELGFKFKNIPDDDLLYEGILPNGWNIQGTEHPMWTEIIDKDNNIRGTMFYKASPYDRKAFMSLNQKYKIEQETAYNPNSVVYSYYFGNEDERLYTSDTVEVFDDDFEEKVNEYNIMLESIKKEVESFADENYPGWNSVKNYWSKTKSEEKVR